MSLLEPLYYNLRIYESMGEMSIDTAKILVKSIQISSFNSKWRLPGLATLAVKSRPKELYIDKISARIASLFHLDVLPFLLHMPIGFTSPNRDFELYSLTLQGL